MACLINLAVSPGLMFPIINRSLIGRKSKKILKTFNSLSSKPPRGETFTDSQFSNNVKGAQAAGIQAGAYHYAKLLRGKAEKEAQNFVDKLKQHQLDLMPVLDLEEKNTDMTADEIADWVLAFAEHVKKETGEQVLLYTFPDYINRFNGFNNRLKDMPL
ncbi:hypothetical protein AB849_010450 [Thermoactinomyces vulgaris]|nr:GH25 family lysozyme [Thermoactinomyces vulgaris]QBK13977.1 hypothetical protein AB849_010450 [Thermoactinomyces vulgaris]